MSQGGNLVDMIKENLIAERIAVDHYRELIRYFGNDDPGTKSMMRGDPAGRRRTCRRHA